MSVAPLSAIGDVVDQVVSWQPERDDPDGTFTYIDLSAVDQEAKIVTGARELACSEAPSRARQLVHAGDVLVSTVRPNLNGVAHVPMEFDGATASTGFCVLRPRASRLDGRYLYQWVKSPGFVGDMVRKATGASYPAVSDRIVWESKLPLPPLPEQRRIAEILDKADALRAKRRATLAQLDTLTQSVFLDMFGDPATNPKGWPVDPLGDLMSEVYRYPTYYGIRYVEKGVPEIRGELLNEDGTIVTDATALRYISPETSKRFPRTVLAEGDLVMSVRGTVGKTAVVPAALAGANMTANLLRLAPDRNRAHPTYVWHFMQTEWFRSQLANACSNTTIQAIKAPDLKRIGVIRPPIDCQRDFNRILSFIQAQKTVMTAGMAGLDSLFVSTQHRAFRGEL